MAADQGTAHNRTSSGIGWLWHLLPAGLVVLGVALRLWNVGRASLWLDEAGVAYAARMPSIPDMLAVVRSHVMAMPLDYLLVWLVARFRVDEGALRLPAVLWGILSLVAAYGLFKRLTSRPAALAGLFFLVLSPLHIQYSQELRFYSSLVFFYLLSTLLLLDAIRDPSPRRWAIFSLAHAVGLYFHPYVLLAWVNGLIWAVLHGLERRSPGGRPGDLFPRRLRLGLLASGLASLIAFLVGYRLFSAGNFFVIPLMVFEESPLAAVAVGLGWLPFQPLGLSWSWLWGGLCFLLEAAGVVTALRSGRLTPLAGVVYSLAAEVAFVLGSDLAGHYFFAPRQLLMLQPLLCLLAGVGLQRMLARAERGSLAAGVRSAALPAAVFALLLIASAPAISAVYQDDKGDTRSISQIMAGRWQPGDMALVTPAYDGFVYKYYLENVDGRRDITQRLFTADFSALSGVQNTGGSVYLITPLRLDEPQVEALRIEGYRQIFTSLPESRYAKRLWVREGISQ